MTLKTHSLWPILLLSSMLKWTMSKILNVLSFIFPDFPYIWSVFSMIGPIQILNSNIGQCSFELFGLVSDFCWGIFTLQEEIFKIYMYICYLQPCLSESRSIFHFYRCIILRHCMSKAIMLYTHYYCNTLQQESWLGLFNIRFAA